MNKPITRRWLLATGAALAAPAIARAQSSLPHKPIRILVGYPSSGGSDSLVHIMAGELQRQLSRSVTVDFKPGDSGMAAGEQLKKATPDGSVIAFIPSATMVGKLTIPGFPFDPLTDILPLTLAGTYPTAFCLDVRRLCRVAEGRRSGSCPLRHHDAGLIHTVFRHLDRPRDRHCPRIRSLSWRAAAGRRP
jgi:hypothetical protein